MLFLWDYQMRGLLGIRMKSTLLVGREEVETLQKELLIPPLKFTKTKEYKAMKLHTALSRSVYQIPPLPFQTSSKESPNILNLQYPRSTNCPNNVRNITWQQIPKFIGYR